MTYYGVWWSRVADIPPLYWFEMSSLSRHYLFQVYTRVYLHMSFLTFLTLMTLDLRPQQNYFLQVH